METAGSPVRVSRCLNGGGTGPDLQVGRARIALDVHDSPPFLVGPLVGIGAPTRCHPSVVMDRRVPILDSHHSFPAVPERDVSWEPHPSRTSKAWGQRCGSTPAMHSQGTAFWDRCIASRLSEFLGLFFGGAEKRTWAGRDELNDSTKPGPSSAERRWLEGTGARTDAGFTA